MCHQRNHCDFSVSPLKDPESASELLCHVIWIRSCGSPQVRRKEGGNGKYEMDLFCVSHRKASLGRKGKFWVSAEQPDFPPSLNQVIMLDSIENFIWHLFILCYQAATMGRETTSPSSKGPSATGLCFFAILRSRQSLSEFLGELVATMEGTQWWETSVFLSQGFWGWQWWKWLWNCHSCWQVQVRSYAHATAQCWKPPQHSVQLPGNACSCGGEKVQAGGSSVEEGQESHTQITDNQDHSGKEPLLDLLVQIQDPSEGSPSSWLG